MLSDGDPALPRLVRGANGADVRHILDWWHISMRIRHVETTFQTLFSLMVDPVGLEVETLVQNLRWHIWHGQRSHGQKAPDALAPARFTSGGNGTSCGPGWKAWRRPTPGGLIPTFFPLPTRSSVAFHSKENCDCCHERSGSGIYSVRQFDHGEPIGVDTAQASQPDPKIYASHWR